MNTLRELQDFEVQENVGCIADKTADNTEGLNELCIILPDASETNLVSGIPPSPLDNAYYIKLYSEL